MRIPQIERIALPKGYPNRRPQLSTTVGTSSLTLITHPSLHNAFDAKTGKPLEWNGRSCLGNMRE